MPRQARPQIAGLPLHVMQRGVNKGLCFQGDDDRTLYLGMLAELIQEFACDIHAYVLMSNHVHLLLTPNEPRGLSGLMRNLGQRYVQAYNRRHGRTGPLWNSRFKGSLVDSENYLFICYRYIESNPVRAGMVCQPALYPWSSHHANAFGVGSFVSPHGAYVGLGNSPLERQAAYRAMFDSELSPEELAAVRGSIKRNLPLGNDEFLLQLETSLGRSVRPGRAGRPRLQKSGERKENLAASPV